MKKIRFGIIGCGLMGKEFASAAARWCHFTEKITRPEIVAVCDFSDAAMDWFSDNFDSVVFRTKDFNFSIIANCFEKPDILLSPLFL